MHRRQLVASAVAALLVSLAAVAMLATAPPAPQSARPPNVIFFLVDDLGYMDIRVNNPETFYDTPHIDRLAAEGLRFTNAYAANPVCSPTRFSIMTGRYPSRVGATNWFAGVREGRFRPAPLTDRMPLEETTVAEAMKAGGYRTAFVGKWHLGPDAAHWPEAQGFDINIAGHDVGSPPGGYFGPFKNPRLDPGTEGEYLTDRLARESIRLINSFGDDPFLLVHSFYSVHTPLQAPASSVATYEAKAARLPSSPAFGPEEQVWPVDAPREVRLVQNHPTYAAMVSSMDAAVGRVLQAVVDAGIEQDTIVFFTSDNGGLSTSEGSPTSNLPFRGGKGWLYEGGIREPLIVKWPGGTTPGTVSHVPVISTDFYPTMLEMAGLDSPAPDRPIDGVSLEPVLRGEDRPVHDALFWHYPHYSNQGGFPGGAIRVGDVKLIERFEDGRVHLYDLAADPGERTDLAADQPARTNDLRRRLHAWYESVGARFLEPKPGGPAPWRP